MWQAVRTVFNIAIGADSADLQRTARSALLQMLNTIMKRVTMAAAVGVPSCLTPRLPSKENRTHENLFAWSLCTNRACGHAY